jgi:hypothetical protein
MHDYIQRQRIISQMQATVTSVQTCTVTRTGLIPGTYRYGSGYDSTPEYSVACGIAYANQDDWARITETTTVTLADAYLSFQGGSIIGQRWSWTMGAYPDYTNRAQQEFIATADPFPYMHSTATVQFHATNLPPIERSAALYISDTLVSVPMTDTVYTIAGDTVDACAYTASCPAIGVTLTGTPSTGGGGGVTISNNVTMPMHYAASAAQTNDAPGILITPSDTSYGGDPYESGGWRFKTLWSGPYTRQYDTALDVDTCGWYDYTEINAATFAMIWPVQYIHATNAAVLLHWNFD